MSPSPRVRNVGDFNKQTGRNRQGKNLLQGGAGHVLQQRAVLLHLVRQLLQLPLLEWRPRVHVRLQQLMVIVIPILVYSRGVTAYADSQCWIPMLLLRSLADCLRAESELQTLYSVQCCSHICGAAGFNTTACSSMPSAPRDISTNSALTCSCYNHDSLL